jgi:hypothetical protein
MLWWVLAACSRKSEDTTRGADDSATSCVPHTCEDLGAACGQPDDGCGALLTCGTCDWGSTCGDGLQCAPACDGDVARTLSTGHHDVPAVALGDDGIVRMVAEDSFGGRIAYAEPKGALEEVFASKFSPGLYLAVATAGGLTHVVSSFHTNVPSFEYARRDASGVWTAEPGPYVAYYPTLAITADDDGAALVSFVADGSEALSHGRRSAGGAWSEEEANPCIDGRGIVFDAARRDDGTVLVVAAAGSGSTLATRDAHGSWSCDTGPPFDSRGKGPALRVALLPDGRVAALFALDGALALYVGDGKTWTAIDLGALSGIDTLDVAVDGGGFVTYAASSSDEVTLGRLHPDAPDDRTVETIAGHAAALEIDPVGVQHVTFVGPENAWEYRAFCPFDP